MSNSVTFYLNGETVTLEDPSPGLLLIDFLRSPEVGLTGAKKGCGQGGCGACTVILSTWNPENNEVDHRSINSCLRPVCALGGLSITTIEGTGDVERIQHQHPHFNASFSRGGTTRNVTPSPHWLEQRDRLTNFRLEKLEKANVLLAKSSELKAKNPCAEDAQKDEHEGMNPVAHRLAMNNGTQCGYCTTGFVMNMSAFLANNPARTQREIEGIFDGNICRCTGYRPILTGMKTFATDWTKKDELERMKCVSEEKCAEQLVHPHISIPVPEESRNPPEPVTVTDGEQTWVTPTSLDELIKIMRTNRNGDLRLVFANTSFGIYPDEFYDASILVDVRLIDELYGVDISDDEIVIGASTTYSQFIEALPDVLRSRPSFETSRWGAIDFMARRTAGMIVRNAASIGGNNMLVLHHIFEGEPFPSDIFTALDAAHVEIEFIQVSTGKRSRLPVRNLVERVIRSPKLADDIVLIRYFMPVGMPNEVVLAQKVALRQVNAHSIVNVTTRFDLTESLEIENLDLVFGGIAPYPWRAANTQRWMKGKKLSLDMFPQVAQILARETKKELEKWTERMAGLPDEGFTEEYKVELATSFLYKAVVNALDHRDPESVPPEVRSAGLVEWGRWPVSNGLQHYTSQKYKAPVSVPYIKLMAFNQAMGTVHYTHEIELPPIGKNAAFVQSQRALAQYHYHLPGSEEEQVTADEIRIHLADVFEGFYDMVTYDDIPEGGVNYQGMGFDQPIFAVDRINYFGQSIALIIAETEQEAIEIAAYTSDTCIGYSPVDWADTKPVEGSDDDFEAWPQKWDKPILSIEEAISMGSIFPDCPETAPWVTHIWKVTRPGSLFDWVNGKPPLDKDIQTRKTKVDGNLCLVVENTQESGGQVHFYMETQSCVAEPQDGDRILLHPSTQSPMEMHQTAAMSIASEHNKINVELHQVGGGYGGKTEQTRFVTGPVTVAATVLKRPIRLAMKRECDTAMIGKRHSYYGQYQIAIDQGDARADDRGLIRGIQVKMWGDGGAFYDCSFIVSNCIQLRTDNAYNITNFESQIDVCRTNTAPNTAFRSFGDIQGKLICENAVDDASYALGMSPFEVRKKNMYYRGDVTPFGQALSYCYMREVWNYTRLVSKYDEKVEAVEDFNKRNKWKKRGVYMIPVKYGSGYNLVMLEQAAAVVSVFSGDGSIVIHQGGSDMGQGIITQIEQVASYVLNVPMDLIEVTLPRTSVTPNPTSSGGSTGTPYNAEAAKRVCEDLRSRLTEFGYKLLKDEGNSWCRDQGIDFWNYPIKEDDPVAPWGWAVEVTKQGTTSPSLIWQNLVALAYQYRVNLVSSFTAPIKGGETPVPNMTFKNPHLEHPIPGIKLAGAKSDAGAVDSFVGFTYSAACSMVELDVLTGEVKVLSTDLVYDMGWSLNPALDIGQVEGAFIQGLGYVLTEKLMWEPQSEDDNLENVFGDTGRLNTLNTWRYKPPAITTIPLEMNTYLYPRNLPNPPPPEPTPEFPQEVLDNPSKFIPVNVPENVNNGIFSAKEVGEPPLVLASSVFFALKAAIRATRVERKLSPLFKFDAPATVQEVRNACAVENKAF